MRTRSTFQPYFVAYCRAIGKAPTRVARDFKGHEFIVWMGEQWRRWDELHHDGKRPSYRPDTEHEALGAWLAKGSPDQTEMRLTA